MVRAAFLLLLTLAGPAWGTETGDRFSFEITLGQDYHYQGMRQDEGGISLSGSLLYRFSEKWTGGVWVGEYEVPWYKDASVETDYFLAHRRQFSFNHEIEISLWHYDYHDQAYDHYDWTQFLLQYHYGDVVTLTGGVASGFLDLGGKALFTEVTIHQRVGPITFGVSAGHHRLPGDRVAGFSYGQFGGGFHRQNWTFELNYTATQNSDNRITRRLAHKGTALVFRYRFPARP